MELLYSYKAQSKGIEKNTIKKHTEEIELCLDGIELVNEIGIILDGLEYSYATPESAIKSLLWRYYSSIPSTAYNCLSTAIQGHYRISYSIFRILIEEVVSIKYYVQESKSSYNIIKEYLRTNKFIEPKISIKLNRINSDPKSSLKLLYNQISETSSHANALKFPAKLISSTGDKLIKVHEPKYNSDSMNWIFVGLIRLLSTSIRVASIVYPELENNNRYREISNDFMEKSLALLSTEEIIKKDY